MLWASFFKYLIFKVLWTHFILCNACGCPPSLPHIHCGQKNPKTGTKHDTAQKNSVITVVKTALGRLWSGVWFTVARRCSGRRRRRSCKHTCRSSKIITQQNPPTQQRPPTTRRCSRQKRELFHMTKLNLIWGKTLILGIKSFENTLVFVQMIDFLMFSRCTYPLFMKLSPPACSHWIDKGAGAVFGKGEDRGARPQTTKKEGGGGRSLCCFVPLSLGRRA